MVTKRASWLKSRSDEMVNPQEIIASIRYKDGWELKFKQEEGRACIFWTFTSPDYTLPGMPATSWNSRKWYLSEFMVESEIVQTALAAALLAEEHEVREAFSYKGVHLFNPHISMEAMMEASVKLNVRS